MEQETISIDEKKYEDLRKKAIKLSEEGKIDLELFEQLLESFRDYKEGRFRRVR
jgi:hypothetical protein